MISQTLVKSLVNHITDWPKPKMVIYSIGSTWTRLACDNKRGLYPATREKAVVIRLLTELKR